MDDDDIESLCGRIQVVLVLAFCLYFPKNNHHWIVEGGSMRLMGF